jgi:hypothetical protein
MQSSRPSAWPQAKAIRCSAPATVRCQAMTAQDDALTQLGTLLDDYNKLREQASVSTLPYLPLIHRLLAAIERLTVPTSTYARAADRVRDSRANIRTRLVELAAIAKALREDIQAGWLASVVELAHADTYNDYLERAEGLLGQGYKDAAAVIAGTSLEVHLKSLAVKHGVDLQLPTGNPKKANTLAADLKHAGVYNAVEHQQILAWQTLRNAAAHGQYGDYDDTGVKGLIEGVRTFAVKYPA